MNITILLFLMLLFLPLHASGQYENNQNDWSGGPIVQNPDWGFGNTFFSSDSVHWQSPDTLRLENYTGGFAGSGEIVSSIIIIPIPTDYGMWGNLFWSAEVPDQTLIEFYLRASTDWQNMGSWYGPFTENPTDLSTVMPDAQDYLQYKAVLTSDNADSSPVLCSVSIEASHPGGIEESSSACTNQI
ncbi:MAG: hypothetical protein GY852_11675, partial [bacterium]|nr:hypothetical protein [bacterium]